MNFIVMSPFLLLGWAELSKQLRLVERSLHLHIERDEEKSTRVTNIFLDQTMRAVPGSHNILRRVCRGGSEQVSVPGAATTLGY